MVMTAVARKKTRPEEEAATDDWPAQSRAAKVVARLRDEGVTFGWRLKNAGLERVGLWMVRKCHRGSSATG